MKKKRKIKKRRKSIHMIWYELHYRLARGVLWKDAPTVGELHAIAEYAMLKLRAACEIIDTQIRLGDDDGELEVMTIKRLVKDDEFEITRDELFGIPGTKSKKKVKK
jgi:hypothetical protein